MSQNRHFADRENHLSQMRLTGYTYEDLLIVATDGYGPADWIHPVGLCGARHLVIHGTTIEALDCLSYG